MLCLTTRWCHRALFTCLVETQEVLRFTTRLCHRVIGSCLVEPRDISRCTFLFVIRWCCHCLAEPLDVMHFATHWLQCVSAYVVFYSTSAPSCIIMHCVSQHTGFSIYWHASSMVAFYIQVRCAEFELVAKQCISCK